MSHLPSQHSDNNIHNRVTQINTALDRYVIECVNSMKTLYSIAILRNDISVNDWTCERISRFSQLQPYRTHAHPLNILRSHVIRPEGLDQSTKLENPIQTLVRVQVLLTASSIVSFDKKLIFNYRVGIDARVCDETGRVRLLVQCQIYTVCIYHIQQSWWTFPGASANILGFIEPQKIWRAKTKNN